jgi:hypothetical protein
LVTRAAAALPGFAVSAAIEGEEVADEMGMGVKD